MALLKRWKPWNGWAQIELVEIESWKPSLLALQFSDSMWPFRSGHWRSGWPKQRFWGLGLLMIEIKSYLWFLGCSSQWVYCLISLYVYFWVVSLWVWCLILIYGFHDHFIFWISCNFLGLMFISIYGFKLMRLTENKSKKELKWLWIFIF